MIKLMSSGS